MVKTRKNKLSNVLAYYFSTLFCPNVNPAPFRDKRLRRLRGVVLVTKSLCVFGETRKDAGFQPKNK